MKKPPNQVKGQWARVGFLDVVVLAFISAAGLYLAYRVKVALHYEWNWQAIPSYFLRFDPMNGRWVPNLLLQGLLTTLRLSVWGILIALVVGTVVGIGRLSRSRFQRMLARFYVELIRNLPPLVLVFIFYYFIGDQIMTMIGLDMLIEGQSAGVQAWLAVLLAPPELLTPFISALIALGLFEGAYIAEIVRAGIQSIEKGQWEASNALGLSRWQQSRHIILPQVLPRILPSAAGQFISTIKDSSIVSVISIQELTFQGLELMAATYLDSAPALCRVVDHHRTFWDYETRHFNTDISATLDSGAVMLHYLGRASELVWGVMYEDDDAQVLANCDMLPFVIGNTCHSGRFAEPTEDCISEAFLRRESTQNGAVAFWGSTGATSLGPGYVAGATFMELAFQDGRVALGDATTEGKLRAGEEGLRLRLKPGQTVLRR